MNFKGLKISICQMPVIAGRPDLNKDYVISSIQAAASRNVDIIVFPEMCITGYIAGDLFEDSHFIKDTQICNEQIKRATTAEIIAIFGTITTENKEKGEDGRVRKFNTALIAQNGEWIGAAIKTLQPNYRIFNDDRHFYSLRKIAESKFVTSLEDFLVEDLYKPVLLQTSIGEIRLGVILCEDMWQEDYQLNPTSYLVENGAEIVVNISASPWSWQKNRKRHEVVKRLLSDCKVPFVYVNNTGVQNTGKNIVVFDGSSTIYSATGEPLFEVGAYKAGVEDFVFDTDNRPIITKPTDDTTELYQAVKKAVEGMFKTLPPDKRKVVVGVSGGIDSALTTAIYVDLLGAENVLAVNMPSRYNSLETQSTARKLAENLQIRYEVKPIEEIVEVIARTTNSKPNSPTYENIQARVRMEILAALAQNLGAVFSSNWNKVEAAFGYGTLYGDMAGFIAPIGDLVKREVYQLADYFNRVVFGREVIPQKCFEMRPTAELSDGQVDPFDYGNLHRRGYHDEMVRAFTEFRRNPEWFLEKYAHTKLEEELKLEKATLSRLFRSTREFIKDLEQHWYLFHASYFKRVQSTAVPIVSKRAFGTDLRESILAAHFTERYKDLKKVLLSRYTAQQRVAIFGGSFNPPGLHHRRIAEKLSRLFDLVVIVPCGFRSDKVSVNEISHHHRKELVKMAFNGISNLELDMSDLDQNSYTPTYLLDERYRERFPDSEIWHAVGGDIVAGGRNADSQIHRVWKQGAEIWYKLNFAIFLRPGYSLNHSDLPPSSELIEIANLIGSATSVRDRVRAELPIDNLVSPEVAAYIAKNKLYKK
ncbi:MAG: NAD(+) synthase [Blastocatellia bacterium]|nr:NAD(+) synthase [Blastocatellia bacterium]